MLREERIYNMWEEELCRSQGQWRGSGGRCSRHLSWDCPAGWGADHGEAAVPLQPCRSVGIKRSTCKGGDPCWAMDRGLWPYWKHLLKQAPGRDLQACGDRSPGWTGFLAALATPWGTHPGEACFWRTHPMEGDPLWDSLWRTVTHSKDSGGVNGVISPLGRTSCWSREGLLSLRNNLWWTDHNPHPHLRLPPTRHRKEEGVGEKVF